MINRRTAHTCGTCGDSATLAGFISSCALVTWIAALMLALAGCAAPAASQRVADADSLSVDDYATATASFREAHRSAHWQAQRDAEEWERKTQADKVIRDAHEANIRDRLPLSPGNWLTDTLKEPLTLGLMRTETYDSQDITKRALDAGIFTLEEAQNGTVTDEQLRMAFDYARVMQFADNPGVLRAALNAFPVIGMALNWGDMSAMQKIGFLVKDAAIIAFVVAYKSRSSKTSAKRRGRAGETG